MVAMFFFNIKMDITLIGKLMSNHEKDFGRLLIERKRAP